MQQVSAADKTNISPGISHFAVDFYVGHVSKIDIHIYIYMYVYTLRIHVGKYGVHCNVAIFGVHWQCSKKTTTFVGSLSDCRNIAKK